MKRPQLVSSGSLDRMLKSAEESWSRRDFQQAIEILERASRLNPGNTTVLVQLGGYYGLRYDYASAERCFERAVRIAPAKAKMLTLAGKKCMDFAKQELAERYFKQAFGLKDVSPEAYVKLAELYERQHKGEQAAELVERAMQQNAACGLALLACARQ